MTSAEKLDEIMAKIDAAIGSPESETAEERVRRRAMVARDAERRRLRKSAAGDR